MTWAKLDDAFYSHPKRRAAGFEALGLWVVAISYCAHRLNDGAITTDEVLDLCRGNQRVMGKLSTALVTAGLWEQTPEGFQFHDWQDYQPTRAQVLSERARKAEAGRKGGYRSGEARASTNGEAGASSGSRTPPIPPADPARPADARARAREPGPGPDAQAAHAAKLAELANAFGPKAMP